MYKYETHLHTAPVSQCAVAGVEQTLEFYKALGYDGVFITNHFLDGNINYSICEKSYEEQIEFYFSDYEKGYIIGKKLGIKVFPGVELSYKGTDFLVYGLDKEWYLSHPEIMDMKKSDELKFMMEFNTLIVQAHPYREAGYIDHIRLFPRNVHGVETVNANQPEDVNSIADIYADHYGLLKTAGSDCHVGKGQKKLAGLSFDEPIEDVYDFIQKVKAGKSKIFTLENN